jgi:hypothetical protein
LVQTAGWWLRRTRDIRPLKMGLRRGRCTMAATSASVFQRSRASGQSGGGGGGKYGKVDAMGRTQGRVGAVNSGVSGWGWGGGVGERERESEREGGGEGERGREREEPNPVQNTIRSDARSAAVWGGGGRGAGGQGVLTALGEPGAGPSTSR